jgi:hypothetical protein
MFEQENAFFEANIDTFRKNYLGKELVIVGNTILGVYDDVGTALRETIKTYPMGAFTIKQVEEHPMPMYIPFYRAVI